MKNYVTDHSPIVASWLLMKEKRSRAWKQTRAKFSLKGVASLLKWIPPPALTPAGPARDRKWVEHHRKASIVRSAQYNTYHQGCQ